MDAGFIPVKWGGLQVPADFDPYYEWLSIPPEEHPPDHYRLLGLKRFESNTNVIENAADRQMSHLRNLQSGGRGDLTQQLLNEISAARIVLLEENAKAAYDEQLRRKFSDTKRKEIPIATAQPLVQNVAQNLDNPQPDSPANSPPIIVGSGKPERGSPQPLLNVYTVGAIASLVLLLAAGGLVTLYALGNAAPRTIAGSNANVDDGRPAQNTRPTSINSDVEHKPDLADSPVGSRDNLPTSIQDQPLEDADASPPVPDPEEIDDPDVATDTQPRPIVEFVSDPGPIVEPVRHEATPEVIKPKPTRHPVPDRAKRNAKRREIESIFSVGDARSIEAKAKIAAQLLRTGRETEDDLVVKFALFNLARELASEAGEIKIAFEAIDELEATFEFPSDAVKVATIDAAVRAKLPPEDRREIVAMGVKMLEGFLSENRFPEANAVLDRLVGVARSLRDREMMRQLAELREVAETLAREYQSVQTAFEKLETAPDDPDANLAVGRYLIFVRKNWDAGLAHLAKGSNKVLADAAQAELADPRTTDTELSAADAWWVAADNEESDAAERLARYRSAFLYRMVVNDLVGLPKAKAQQRIKDAGEFFFLDDLTEAVARIGCGTLGKHGKTGLVDENTEERHTFQRGTPEHALSMAPPIEGSSFVTYNLDGDFEVFEAKAAMWEDLAIERSTSVSAVTFRVIGDGNVLWQSKPLNAHGIGQDCRVNIRGVETLTLVVTCPGENGWAWSVWINPRITRFDADAYNSP